MHTNKIFAEAKFFKEIIKKIPMDKDKIGHIRVDLYSQETLI